MKAGGDSMNKGPLTSMKIVDCTVLYEVCAHEEANISEK